MMSVVGGDAAATLEVLDPSPSVASIEAADNSWSIFDFFDQSDFDVERHLSARQQARVCIRRRDHGGNH
jgi:hypothetical protein